MGSSASSVPARNLPALNRSQGRMRLSRTALLVALSLFISPTRILAADEAVVSATLTLRSGDFVRGERTPSSDPSHIGWQAPQFAQPLIFPLENIGTISYPVPAVALE